MTKPEHNAFATPLPKDVGYTDENNYNGLSKREYIAAKVLQGLLAKYGKEYFPEHIDESIIITDSFIEALNKTTKQ